MNQLHFYMLARENRKVGFSVPFTEAAKNRKELSNEFNK